MRFPPFRTLAALACVAAAASGCSEDGDPMSPGPGGALPPSVPEATTPANALARFEATWEYGAVGEYDKLLTANFRFRFSGKADPVLDAQWGENWTRVEELASASNLKLGFLDDEGTFQPAATIVALVLVDTAIAPDPAHPDSADWYKVATVPALNASITFPGDQEYVISDPAEVHLVRGDAAVLAPGQEARTDRWYVSRWEDHASAPGAVIHPSRAKTWGSVKAQYH